MLPESGSSPAAPGRSEILRILSPLLLFAAHVVYLAVWSPDPFLKKWLDGSFSFFLALVLCNIIRSRIVAPPGPQDGGGGAPPPAGPGEDDQA